MRSGDVRDDERRHHEELLALTHEAELETLARQYDEQLGALMGEHLREQAELRRRSAGALARLVAQFEKRRAASVARFQTSRQLLSATGTAPRMIVGKA